LTPTSNPFEALSPGKSGKSKKEND